MKNSIALPIVESSQVGEARRIAQALAKRLKFNETEQATVGIIVTELATNLVRHAQYGQLLLQAIEKNNIVGIEILALDKAPGMVNVSECLRDGFSTIGTSGNGLGAIKRLASFFDIYSVVGQGTAIVAQVFGQEGVGGVGDVGTFSLSPSQVPRVKASSSKSRLQVGALCLPKPGEEVSGDAWAIVEAGDRTSILVSDGLGHGLLAAQASLQAVQIFQENIHSSPQEIVEAAHRGLRSTRGVAMAVTQINHATGTIRYAGVGNISAAVVSSEESYRMISYNGTVGYEARKIRELTYQWYPAATLIMHSDGLGTQWRLDRYPGLLAKHPSLIAGILYRDFHRGHDDVTVVVAREER